MDVADVKDINEIHSYLMPSAMECPELMANKFAFSCGGSTTSGEDGPNQKSCFDKKTQFAWAKWNYALPLKRLSVQVTNLDDAEKVK